MEKRPLAREERRRIEYRNGDDHDETINALLAAEAFWREAVKNVNAGYPIVFNSERNDSEACAFCEASVNITKGEQLEHKPDCPWVLANES